MIQLHEKKKKKQQEAEEAIQKEKEKELYSLYKQERGCIPEMAPDYEQSSV